MTIRQRIDRNQAANQSARRQFEQKYLALKPRPMRALKTDDWLGDNFRLWTLALAGFAALAWLLFRGLSL